MEKTFYNRISTNYQGKVVSEEFNSIWQFPNCLGAIDGKHVEIQAPPNSGSLFFNYKKTFSIVLLSLVDANYKFIAVDVGAYGKSSDGGIFAKSSLGTCLEAGTLNIPEPKPLPNSDEALPFVIIGDEAFPLKTYLLRPYAGTNARDDETKKIYNYRLSRARRVVENAFGILTQKFRIFYGRIQMNPENIDKVILAACALHNYVRDDVSVEEPENEGNAVLEQRTFTAFRHVGGRANGDAIHVREQFCNYLNTTGAVPWQLSTVRSRST